LEEIKTWRVDDTTDTETGGERTNIVATTARGPTVALRCPCSACYAPTIYSIYSKCNIGFNGTIPARRQSPINREFRMRKLVGVNNAARSQYVPCNLSQRVATANQVAKEIFRAKDAALPFTVTFPWSGEANTRPVGVTAIEQHLPFWSHRLHSRNEKSV
jgi:hypothetical protein